MGFSRGHAQLCSGLTRANTVTPSHHTACLRSFLAIDFGLRSLRLGPWNIPIPAHIAAGAWIVARDPDPPHGLPCVGPPAPPPRTRRGRSLPTTPSHTILPPRQGATPQHIAGTGPMCDSQATQASNWSASASIDADHILSVHRFAVRSDTTLAQHRPAYVGPAFTKASCAIHFRLRAQWRCSSASLWEKGFSHLAKARCKLSALKARL